MHIDTAPKFNTGLAGHLADDAIAIIQDQLYGLVRNLLAADDNVAENVAAALEVAVKFGQLQLFQAEFVSMFTGLTFSQLIAKCKVIGLDPVGQLFEVADYNISNALQACRAFYAHTGVEIPAHRQ